MKPNDRIELALRAAKTAKTVLEMIEVKNEVQARLVFIHAVREIQEMDKLIDRMEGSMGQ
jgi:hypothetical protein